MPPIRFNGSTNYNASDIARRAQGRAVFANSLVNQKSLDNTCLNRVVAGPAAATSYSASKYIDQRVGTIFTTPAEAALIVESSPCQKPPGPIVYPNYILSCDDSVGIQIMATGAFTSFTFTTTSQGAGVLEFQFFLDDVYQSSQLVVLDVDSNLITPPSGINEVRYVFRCSPMLISLSCTAASRVLQWTNPYSFQYLSDLSGASIELTLYPRGGTPFTHIVAGGSTYTPTPAWGYDSWSIPSSECTVGSLAFSGGYLSVDGSGAPNLNLGADDYTVEWYQYYDSTTANAYPALFNYKTSTGAFIMSVSYNNSTNRLTYFETYETNVSVDISSYKDTWCHIAICRSAGVVYIYQNGISLGSVESSTDFADETNVLYIGNDTGGSGLSYKGLITNFRLVVGLALYPGGTTFTPPATPLTAIIGTQLLLDVFSPMRSTFDSSSVGRLVDTSGSVDYSYEHP